MARWGMGDLRSPGSWDSVPGQARVDDNRSGCDCHGREREAGAGQSRFRGQGWHTAAMSETPPPDPKANDVWIDDHGELRYFNGNEWVPYPDVPDGDLQPEVVIKGEED